FSRSFRKLHTGPDRFPRIEPGRLMRQMSHARSRTSARRLHLDPCGKRLPFCRRVSEPQPGDEIDERGFTFQLSDSEVDLTAVMAAVRCHLQHRLREGNRSGLLTKSNGKLTSPRNFQWDVQQCLFEPRDIC